MEFDPAFALLAKFNIGLRTDPKTEEDVQAVSKYLGVDPVGASLTQNISILSEELSFQNGFLSRYLEGGSIFSSEEYRKSVFIREVVANNRINRQNRANQNI